MKVSLKRLVIVVLILVVAIQFYQPALNKDRGKVNRYDFINLYNAPANIGNMLKTSCYNCHSDNTNYAWFDYVQPARLFVESHISNAKQDLNFSEWGRYSKRKQERLITDIKKQVETGEMPLSSYKWLHREAKLDVTQIKTLIFWLENSDSTVKFQ